MILLGEVDVALEGEWGGAEEGCEMRSVKDSRRYEGRQNLTLHVVKDVPNTRGAIFRRASSVWVGVELLSCGMGADESGEILCREALRLEMLQGLITANIGCWKLSIWCWASGIGAADVCLGRWSTRA